MKSISYCITTFTDGIIFDPPNVTDGHIKVGLNVSYNLYSISINWVRFPCALSELILSLFYVSVIKMTVLTGRDSFHLYHF